MTGAKDKFLLQVPHLGKHFLVIQAGIPDKTDAIVWIPAAGGLKGLFDLIILADKIDCV
jgi:hypothetical protein